MAPRRRISAFIAVVTAASSLPTDDTRGEVIADGVKRQSHQMAVQATGELEEAERPEIALFDMGGRGVGGRSSHRRVRPRASTPVRVAVGGEVMCRSRRSWCRLV